MLHVRGCMSAAGAGDLGPCALSRFPGGFPRDSAPAAGHRAEALCGGGVVPRAVSACMHLVTSQFGSLSLTRTAVTF